MTVGTAILPAVRMEKVVVALGGRTLLDVPSLTIGSAERVAIVGANGAGKSTLLRVLSGFVVPSYGTLQVLGQPLGPDLTQHDLRRLRARVGQVMQELHLVERLTAIDNVLIGCLARVTGWRSWVRWHARSDVELARAALHSVGMLAKAQVRTDQLSGGERQKVAIARLLMQAPRLILADEPTAALDPAAALEVCKLLVQSARNAALITVVHNPALIALLADRVIGLKAGTVVFDLPAADLDDQRLTDLYRATPFEPAAHWQLAAHSANEGANPSLAALVAAPHPEVLRE